jgi:trehalose/maltose hydrolase-like predicted phosphorylase
MVIDGDTVSRSDISGWHQVFDMKKAELTTSFTFKDKAKVSYVTYALRSMPYAGLVDVHVTALKEISVSVAGNIICPPEYAKIVQNYKVLRDKKTRMPLLQTTADSPSGKHRLAATATFVFDGFSPDLREEKESPLEHSLVFHEKVGKGEGIHFTWEGAVCTTGNFSDPQSESERMAIYIRQGNENAVVEEHLEKWKEMWNGDIEVVGDPESQVDIRLALYHLYAFSCEGSRLSIPPMGLSSQGYNGHIFWDAELWMFPPLLLLNQGIARSMVDYRSDRLGKAMQKAADYGFKGAMFPWESDDSGEEATPTFALTGAFEHHITADVGIAFWNYFRVTGDKEWLREEGFPVLREIADFWVSRATCNSDGTYSIKNVVGADEYAQNVNDDAFTNGSVKQVLGYASRAASQLGEKADPSWEKVADGLRFYKFPDGVTKEYESYDEQTIKQADANMLAYPLQIETDTTSIRKDLDYYEKKMDKNGPAMGYSILSILYARLGNPEEAYRLFKKAYVPNKRPPFGALAESANKNNPYFATGAGGMLQTVLFGFGGLEITDLGIIQHSPCLPPKWKKLIIKGVGPDHKTYEISGR